MQENYAAIMEELRAADLEALPPLRISVLRNVMIEPMEPYVRHQAMRMGFRAEVRFGEYDNVVQEALGGRPDLVGPDTDCVLVFMRLEGASWDLARNYNALSDGQRLQEIERLREQSRLAAHGLRERTGAMILWHGFEAPLYPALGIHDQQGDGQLETVAALNRQLREVLAEVPGACFVDMDLCLRRVGADQFLDPRYWHLGRAPYTLRALGEIVAEDFKFLRALKGRNRKCLVLDCDNTLWGGILGEDGMSGIKLGKSYPGSEFHEFQQQVLDLHHRGVILALCSKNNEADVREVLRDHPDMLIRERHVAAAQINWEDKVRNLRQLALDLNIGLDSMVFADDSEFEVNLVREHLPEVAVIHLPKNDAVNHYRRLASCGLFDTLTVTAEDRAKGAMYKAEAGRRKLQAEVTDMETYYRSLEMVVDIALADGFSVPRVAQQTQKTNQFNLTTRRYGEADIARFVESRSHDVICLKLTDRFGDSGIVGACILSYQGDAAVFDTLLVSCRVLGRGVEDAFMAHVLGRARARGAARAVGEYWATRKNGQVSDFYARQGFCEVEPGRADRTFEYDLAAGLPEVPDYFKAVHSTLTEEGE